MTVVVAFCATIGAAVLVGLALIAVARMWSWVRLHVLRGSPIRLRTLSLDGIRQLKDNHDWDVKIGGLFWRHLGVGFIYGAPPVYTCEARGCTKEFRSLAAAEAHEAEHADLAA